MTSEDDDETVSKKVKTKNSLKGGNPNADSINERDLIEQPFHLLKWLNVENL